MAAKTLGLTFTLASATASDRYYIDRFGETHTITQNQTFTLDLTDLGTTGEYIGDNTSSEMTCTDGTKINLEADKAFTYFVTGDGAMSIKGEICIVEEGKVRAHWRIRSMNIDDADNPATCECTLERVDDPMVAISWAGITVA